MAISPQDQEKWLQRDIPHRVRACLAFTKRLDDLIGLPKWPANTRAEQIARRCATDAIWEGRLCAMRWLIEFVGLTEDKHHKPIVRNKTKANDFRIDDLPGGVLIRPSSREAQTLAPVWKGGTQGSSHPTHLSNHPPVNNHELAAALEIIVDHLDKTIYASAPQKVIDLALQPPP